jgi:iron(III) transport system ATP-binding protein
LLAVERVSKRFGDVAAVGGVDVTAAPGEFVTLLGPSGCGKTTLLRMIAGIESPSGGRITIDGRVVNDAESGVMVPPEKRQLGMVFQSYAVWPHMTVRRNVEYPLRSARIGRSERRRRALEALDAVGLAALADRYPAEMSGGQQQRVSLARAIVSRPSLLLLDEPLSNLDARLRESMRVELKRLQLELGLTTLYVTHDQSEALAMSDRILVMDSGRVLQNADPESVYRRPSDLRVARFLGVKNILAGRATGPDTVEIDGGVLRGVISARPLAPGQPVRLAVRPDAFEAAGADDPDVRGSVVLAEFLGVGYEHQIEVSRQTVLTVHTPERLGTRGEAVALRLRPGGAVAFPAADGDAPDESRGGVGDGDDGDDGAGNEVEGRDGD